MDPSKSVAALVQELESSSPTTIRITAARQLGRLGQYSRLAADALLRAVKDYDQSLQHAAKEALDFMYMHRDGTLAPRRRGPRPAAVEEVEEVDGVPFTRCNFCGKETPRTEAVDRHQERLAGPGRFYCPFCLRHGFNHRGGRDIMALTFRGVIGYYYYAFYQLSRQVWMYAAEIQDYVEAHERAGRNNPVMHYDPDSYLWFVDFARVGDSKRKLHVNEVLKTVGEILMAFDLSENVTDVSVRAVYLKYAEAILKFHQTRTRPPGNRVLAPTLYKTGAPDYATEPMPKWPSSHNHWTAADTAGREKRKIPWEDTRAFGPAILAEAAGRRFS